MMLPLHPHHPPVPPGCFFAPQVRHHAADGGAKAERKDGLCASAAARWALNGP